MKDKDRCLEWEETKADYATPYSIVDIGNMYYWANYWHEQYQAARAESAKEIERLRSVIEDINEAAHRINDWTLAYPKDIFTPPTPEQWKQAHEFFKTQGFSIDRISGEYGRRIISSIEPQIKAIMQALAATQNTAQKE